MRTPIIVILSLLIFGELEVRAEEQPFLYFPTEADQPLTCHFCGYRYASGNCHSAIDIDVADDETPIYAASGGKVIEVAKEKKSCKKQPYGIHVKLLHTNGYTTIYGHMKAGTVSLEKGEQVEAGQQIGIGDNTGCSTGSHLHFEVRDPDGVRVDPFDFPANHTQCVPNMFPSKDCGPNALWVECPPKPYDGGDPPEDQDDDGFTVEQGDCNDHNNAVHPGAAELCDGIDNDCNGQTDTDWPDLGTECFAIVGGCQNQGVAKCDSQAGEPYCTAKMPEPSIEICDGEDNDCDGKTDEQEEADAWCENMPGPLNPCTQKFCMYGVCMAEALPDGTPCSDGDACSGMDVCISGICTPGELLDCDDGKYCTIDVCDAQDGCIHTVDPEIEISQCDDAASCTEDVLHPEDCKCTHTDLPVGTPCDPGACQTGDGFCDELSQCIGEGVVDCDDGDPCTQDSCSWWLGCQYNQNPSCP